MSGGGFDTSTWVAMGVAGVGPFACLSTDDEDFNRRRREAFAEHLDDLPERTIELPRYEPGDCTMLRWADIQIRER